MKKDELIKLLSDFGPDEDILIFPSKREMARDLAEHFVRVREERPFAEALIGAHIGGIKGYINRPTNELRKKWFAIKDLDFG